MISRCYRKYPFSSKTLSNACPTQNGSVAIHANAHKVHLEMIDTALFIGERRITDGPTLAVHDPWTHEEIARVVMADDARAEEAAVACATAFGATSRQSSYERKKVLA